MSVVLYECVTGEKPPEVLERMHGGLGTPLAEGHWPGFTKRFLQAIDSGMTIRRRSGRNPSASGWRCSARRMPRKSSLATTRPTRFFAHEMASNEIAAVAPTAPGIDQKDLDTGVPKDPADVQFKRAGEETGASKKGKRRSPTKWRRLRRPRPVEPVAEEAAPPPKKPEPIAEQKKPVAPPPKAKEPADKWYKDPRKAMLAGGGAVALVAALAAGTFMMKGARASPAHRWKFPTLMVRNRSRSKAWVS